MASLGASGSLEETHFKDPQSTKASFCLNSLHPLWPCFQTSSHSEIWGRMWSLFMVFVFLEGGENDRIHWYNWILLRLSNCRNNSYNMQYEDYIGSTWILRDTIQSSTVLNRLYLSRSLHILPHSPPALQGGRVTCGLSSFLCPSTPQQQPSYYLRLLTTHHFLHGSFFNMQEREIWGRPSMMEPLDLCTGHTLRDTGPHTEDTILESTGLFCHSRGAQDSQK